MFKTETVPPSRAGSSCSRKIGGVSSSPTIKPCIIESPKTITRTSAFGSGSGPRQPQELVVCAVPGTMATPMRWLRALSSGPSGTRK